jgi:hypothetical protein
MRKGDKIYSYVDGNLLGVKNSITETLDMQHTWNIGTFSGNNPYYKYLNYNFYGMIDDIFIYKRALNDCEIEALYTGEFPPER